MINEMSEFVRVQEPRMELEDVYELMYFRFLGRVQYIGDFLFHTQTLRVNKGFYKLPMAWGSDDISAFIAAKNGIANTQTIVFQYRVNEQTISKTGNTRIKVFAMIEYWKWVYKFIEKLPKSILENNIVADCLQNEWYKLRIQNLRFFLSEDLYCSPLRVIYWIKQKNILGVSISDLLTMCFKSILIRLKK